MRPAACLALLLSPLLFAMAPGTPTPSATGVVLVRTVDGTRAAPLPLACYQIYADAGGGTRGAYRDGHCDEDDGVEDGVVAFSQLAPGGYLLEEVRPPVGYAAAQDQPAVVEAGQTTEVQVINHPASAPAPPPSTSPTPVPPPSATGAAATPSSVLASPVPGEADFRGLVDIGGDRSLFVACTGAGSPTVLLEAGGPGRTSQDWATVQVQVAPFARVCSYDRASLGQSDPAPAGTRTIQDSVDDLHALIAAADIGCPCVLVGASWGGALVRLYAGQHPGEIAGVVFVDAIPPGFIDRLIELVPSDRPERALLLGADNPEGVDQQASLRQVDAAAPPPLVPAVVIAHGLLLGFPSAFPVDELERAWREGQVALAEMMHGHFIVAGKSGNDVTREQPEVVVDAIGQIVKAVRSPTTALGALRVRTVDKTQVAPLPGACYQVFADAGGGARGAYRGGSCDRDDGAEDGLATLPQLAPGGYVLQQVTAPAGYVAAPDRPVAVPPGGAAVEVVTNVPAGDVTATATVGPAATPALPTPGPTATPQQDSASQVTTMPGAAPIAAKLTYLGALGGPRCGATGVDGVGQAVGSSGISAGERHVGRWNPAMTGLVTCRSFPSVTLLPTARYRGGPDAAPPTIDANGSPVRRGRAARDSRHDRGAGARRRGRGRHVGGRSLELPC